MIQWKDVEPDVVISSANQLFRTVDCISTICALANWIGGRRIHITEECLGTLADHVASERNEVGGLLLGQVFSIETEIRSGYPHLTVIRKAIPCEAYRNSPVSLEMRADVWVGAASHLSNGLIVIGWYHTHPNLGAFFSGTDETTQRSFFNQSYSLGLVIDPARCEKKIFFGASSEEYPFDCVVMRDGMAMAYQGEGARQCEKAISGEFEYSP
jgi:proteasome lid subunit RPN8/RPN11